MILLTTVLDNSERPLTDSSYQISTGIFVGGITRLCHLVLFGKFAGNILPQLERTWVLEMIECA